MRSHSSIVSDAGPAKLIELLPGTSIHTITSWRQRNSIPGQYWKTLSDAGLTNLDELAAAAAARQPTTSEKEAA